jgi:phosphosulfolactate synthase
VTLETREGGKGGICRSNGELRYGLIEEILSAKINHGDLLFEAPSTELQTYFVQRVGPDVNLGNIAATDVIPLETIRLGLRSETLLDFEPGYRDDL